MFSGKQKDVYGVPEEAQTVREATTQATSKRGKVVKNRCRLSTQDNGIVVHVKRSFHFHIKKQDTNSTFTPLAFLSTF